jgi:hypothetical protein
MLSIWTKLIEEKGLLHYHGRLRQVDEKYLIESWWYGSTGKAPAWQVWGPHQFNPQDHQNKTNTDSNM